MNCKLIVLGDKMEIKLANGVQFLALKDEELDDFVNRVEAVVERDYVEDLEVQMVEKKSFAKTAVAQLQKDYIKATGLEADLIESVLESRGADVPAVAKTPTKAAAPVAKVVKATAPVVAKAAKVVKEKVVKEKVPAATLEEAIELAESVKDHVGSICNFTRAGEAITSTGEIKQVTVDKRVNRVYYRIVDEDGRLCHKIVGSPDLKIDAKATKKSGSKSKSR